MKSYYYSLKIDVTETEQTVSLPRSRGFSVINSGDYNVQFEFENDIDSNSLILLVGQSIPINGDMQDIRIKAIPVVGDPPATATVYVAGLQHEKI